MKKLCYLFALLLVNGLAIAQSLGTGAYAFASFDTPGFDSINLGNLNTQFNIPIVSRTGRGTPFNYSIQYNGLVWQALSSGGSPTWVQDNAQWGFSQLVNGTAVSGYLTYNTGSQSCGYTYTAYAYHDDAGVIHPFNYSMTTLCDGTQQTSGDGSSSDGSGYSLVSGNQIKTRNGTLITPALVGSGVSGPLFTDRNGNTITASNGTSFTDTLGVTAMTITQADPSTLSYPTTAQTNLTYPVTEQSDGSTTAAVHITYQRHVIRTNFQCSNIGDFAAQQFDLIDRITLADGSYYNFTYEETPGTPTHELTGRLAYIVLPTGGQIHYEYSGGTCAGISYDGTQPQIIRTTSDGRRVYNRYGFGPNQTGTTLTDEKGNQTVFNFISDAASGKFVETHRTVYQGAVGSSTPLMETFTCYNGASAPCDSTAITLPIAEADITQSFNGGTQAMTKNVYDPSGTLLTYSGQYSDVGTTLMRSFNAIYNSLGNQTANSTGDGNGNTYTYSYFNYDETTPTPTSGIPNHVAVSGSPGNLTSSHTASNLGYLTTTTAYYDTGVPISSTAPGGFTTSYSYDPTQTFVTQTSLPTPSSGIALSTSASYDQQSTMPLLTTGMNGEQTQITQYDARLRPTTITLPNGGQMTTVYTANSDWISHSMSSVNDMTSLVHLYDSYGRISRTASLATNTWYVTDSCYDASGLLQFQSLPYAAGNGFGTAKQCSGAGTSYTYDALGRVTGVSNADGTSSTQYKGRAIKTTDVNGVQKITQYDQLGMLSQVCEISTNTLSGIAPVACSTDITGTGFVTSYSYYLAQHITTVSQNGQQRIFTTDPTGLPTQTQEPERGTTTYSYAFNSTGLVVTRTRPQANQSNANTLTTTTTQYDSLGRVVSLGYNDSLTPSRTFYYDRSDYNFTFPQTFSNEAGRLVGTIGGAGANRTVSQYAYDVMGNVTTMWQCAPSICGPDPQVNNSRPALGFGYDLANNLTYEGDGASGGISYGRSPAGEITSVTNLNYTDQYNTPNLVSNVVNTPFGPTSYQLGNGLYTVNSFDTSGRQNGTWICGGSASFGCGNGSTLYGNYVVHSGSRLTYDEDTNMEPGKAPVYDEFNRLTGMNNAQNGQPFYTYVYDRWGNRTQQNALQGGTSYQANINTANNRITGPSFAPNSFSYDAAGNLINDGQHSYTYDAEGNLLSVDSGSTAQYVYDAMNNRVRVQTASSTYEYLFDPAGHRMSSWLLNGTISGFGNEGRIWSDGKLLATRDWNGTTYFHHSDWLGTERLRTNYQGQIATMSSSLAFGDGFSQTSTDTYGAAQDNNEFAGQDSDSESGTTHAQFRQYSPTQGRWMSPDPYDGSYHWNNPQSFNRYAYVKNNPLSRTDPSGLEEYACSEAGDGSSCDESGDPGPQGGNGGFDPVSVSVTVSTDPDDPVDTDWTYNPIQTIVAPDPSGGSGPSTPAPSSFPIQPNPCLVAGNAPDTSYYAQKGQSAASNPFLDMFNLYHFRRGRFLDAQVGHGANGRPYGGAPSYANYAYGVYMAAAGYTLLQALAGADIAAQFFSRYPIGTPMAGPQYPFNPQVNVDNTTKGFNDQTKGTPCHKPG